MRNSSTLALTSSARRASVVSNFLNTASTPYSSMRPWATRVTEFRTKAESVCPWCRATTSSRDRSSAGTRKQMGEDSLATGSPFHLVEDLSVTPAHASIRQLNACITDTSTPFATEKFSPVSEAAAGACRWCGDPAGPGARGGPRPGRRSRCSGSPPPLRPPGLAASRPGCSRRAGGCPWARRPAPDVG